MDERKSFEVADMWETVIPYAAFFIQKWKERARERESESERAGGF